MLNLALSMSIMITTSDHMSRCFNLKLNRGRREERRCSDGRETRHGDSKGDKTNNVILSRFPSYSIQFQSHFVSFSPLTLFSFKV